MRIIYFILMILAPIQGFAFKCPDYSPPNNEVIKLYQKTHTTIGFKVPSALEGNQVKSITLWVYSTAKEVSGEIVAPLAFKIEQGSATGFFAVLMSHSEAEVTATYTDTMCGPRLEARVSI